MGEDGRNVCYLGCFVFGGGDEVSAVGGHLHVRHLHAVFVRFDILEQFAALRVVLRYRPIFVARDDVF